jgi:xanthine dehydrogenase small subunit
MAVDATLALRRGDEEREVAVAEFFTGYRKTVLRPGELIVCVRVPVAARGRQVRAYKVAKRTDQDISGVCGAFAVELSANRVQHVRVCYGGMAATPRRARACEEALLGRPWTEATIAAAVQALDADLDPISDLRATARYRALVARNLLTKFHRETAGRPGATRVGAEGRA